MVGCIICSSFTEPGAPAAGPGGSSRFRTSRRTSCRTWRPHGTLCGTENLTSWSWPTAPPPFVLSQLIRTAFIPSEGCRFIVCDYSAIEARVLAWLAGEKWVLQEFYGDGLIYEATASMMFHVPKDDIKKGGPRADLRSKGKVATLACGYQGSTGALIQMGALKSGIPEDELPGIVRRWRKANPEYCALLV